jgi:hypothetical protein
MADSCRHEFPLGVWCALSVLLTWSFITLWAIDDPHPRSLHEATLDQLRFDALMSRCAPAEIP